MSLCVAVHVCSGSAGLVLCPQSPPCFPERWAVFMITKSEIQGGLISSAVTDAVSDTQYSVVRQFIKKLRVRDIYSAFWTMKLFFSFF